MIFYKVFAPAFCFFWILLNTSDQSVTQDSIFLLTVPVQLLSRFVCNFLLTYAHGHDYLTDQNFSCRSFWGSE